MSPVPFPANPARVELAEDWTILFDPFRVGVRYPFSVGFTHGYSRCSLSGNLEILSLQAFLERHGGGDLRRRVFSVRARAAQWQTEDEGGTGEYEEHRPDTEKVFLVGTSSTNSSIGKDRNQFPAVVKLKGPPPFSVVSRFIDRELEIALTFQ